MNSNLQSTYQFTHHPHIWGRFVVPQSAWENSIVKDIYHSIVTLSGRHVIVDSVELDINDTPALVIWYDVEPEPLGQKMCSLIDISLMTAFGVQSTSWWERQGNFTRFSVSMPLPEDYADMLREMDREWIKENRGRV